MSASTTSDPGRIFISYRRGDAAYAAGWLFDRLAEQFGKDLLFKDVDSIPLGDDFVKVITVAVASCNVMLVLIGDRWLTLTDEQGRRRLDNSGDFVRLEIEAALARDIRVIPILVGGARMPHADQLPPSLVNLVHRNALELSPSRFRSDTDRLLKTLKRTLTEGRTGDDQADEQRTTETPPEGVPEPISSKSPKASALADIAVALADADPDRAARLIADAEGVAQSITNKSSKASALADIAVALADADLDRAAVFIAEAERYFPAASWATVTTGLDPR